MNVAQPGKDLRFARTNGRVRRRSLYFPKRELDPNDRPDESGKWYGAHVLRMIAERKHRFGRIERGAHNR